MDLIRMAEDMLREAAELRRTAAIAQSQADVLEEAARRLEGDLEPDPERTRRLIDAKVRLARARGLE